MNVSGNLLLKFEESLRWCNGRFSLFFERGLNVCSLKRFQDFRITSHFSVGSYLDGLLCAMFSNFVEGMKEKSKNNKKQTKKRC